MSGEQLFDDADVAYTPDELLKRIAEKRLRGEKLTMGQIRRMIEASAGFHGYDDDNPATGGMPPLPRSMRHSFVPMNVPGVTCTINVEDMRSHKVWYCVESDFARHGVFTVRVSAWVSYNARGSAWNEQESAVHSTPAHGAFVFNSPARYLRFSFDSILVSSTPVSPGDVVIIRSGYKGSA